MGTIIHKTVIVTGPVKNYREMGFTGEVGFTGDLVRLRKFSKAAYPNLTSPIIQHGTNGEATFMIASSGSKLGWDLSNHHDDFINDVISHAKSLSVEVQVVEHGECTPKLVDS